MDYVGLGMYREWKNIGSLKKALYINLETTRLRGRPGNRLQDEMREDVRIVSGEEWQKKVYNREEWEKLLRMAKNHRILHIPME
jgi:hypothetical protein